MKLLTKTGFYALLLVMLGVSALANSTAHAESNTVRTTLCDEVSTPEITIEEPVSDSIVSTANVGLGGTTQRTTQIDIFINDSYSQSLAIEPDGDFETTIALLEGDNLIRVEGYFSCNQTSSVSTVVVTYRPAAQPSDGGDIDTGVPDPSSGDDDSDGGVVVTSEQEPEDVPPIERLWDKLRIDIDSKNASTIIDSLVSPIVYWTGFVTSILLVGVMFFAVRLLSDFGISNTTLLWGVPLTRVVRLVSLIAFIVLLILLFT